MCACVEGLSSMCVCVCRILEGPLEYDYDFTSIKTGALEALALEGFDTASVSIRQHTSAYEAHAARM